MCIYKALLLVLRKATADSWYHPFGVTHSMCTINGIDIVLYRIGWISFAGKIYEGWPTSRRGRKLFREIRPRGIPTDQIELERTQLEKLGFSEE